MPRPSLSADDKRLNIHLGRRVELQRKRLEMKRAQLEEALLLSAGTMVRIERGEKTLDAGMLIALSVVLKVPVHFFFEGLPDRLNSARPPLPSPEFVIELQEFLDHYLAIQSDEERRRLLALLRSIAESFRY